MEVKKWEDEAGNLLKLEFLASGSPNFKDEIKSWVQANTSMNFEEFFNRMERFHLGNCLISMV